MGECMVGGIGNDDFLLKDPDTILKNSLGTLAVQVLAARKDFADMEYDAMLKELRKIIDELHVAYQRVF